MRWWLRKESKNLFFFFFEPTKANVFFSSLSFSFFPSSCALFTRVCDLSFVLCLCSCVTKLFFSSTKKRKILNHFLFTFFFASSPSLSFMFSSQLFHS